MSYSRTQRSDAGEAQTVALLSRVNHSTTEPLPSLLLCMQVASYLKGGPLMWMMLLHLHVIQKSDYDVPKGFIGPLVSFKT